MRIEVYGQAREGEKVLRLALRDDGDGTVAVVAVDEKGNRLLRGHLLTFHTDGAISRCTAVNEELGLQLDNRRRIVDLTGA